MSTTSDHDDPRLKTIRSDGMQEAYWVLPEEERRKGFVRPVRQSYIHVGVRPRYPTRGLTPDEATRYSDQDYVAYEGYPESEEPLVGRFWTEKQLTSGCGAKTTMALAIAQTYARNPKAYGGTFCSTCHLHLPVGEFVWDGTTERVGS